MAMWALLLALSAAGCGISLSQTPPDARPAALGAAAPALPQQRLREKVAKLGLPGAQAQAARRTGVPGSGVTNKASRGVDPLAAGQRQGGQGTARQQSARTLLGCNVTMPCHVCPAAAMRDEADYCVETGWRQQVRCAREGKSADVRFQPCPAMSTAAAGHASVISMELVWALIFLSAWTWLQQRRRLQQGAAGAAARKGAFAPVPMTPLDAA